MTKLSQLDVCHKVAITLFVVVCGGGLGAVGVLTSAQSGQVSLRRLASPTSARLRHGASPLERALRDSMRKYLKDERDSRALLEWTGAGAERLGFYETAWPALERNCFSCHGKNAAQSGLICLYTYADVVPYAATRGDAVKEISSRAHVHLLGLGTTLLALGLLVSATGLPRGWRITIVVVLFISLSVDILAQYLAKVLSPAGYVVWASGVLLALSMAVSAVVVVRDLWLAEGK